MKEHRKICEHHYGPIPEDWDVHHKDGNSNNNDPNNLEPLSKSDHYMRHWKQGDYGACHAIALRMDRTHEEISQEAKLHALQRVEKGTHHFLGGEIQRKSNRERVGNGTHHWLGGKIQRAANQKRVKNGTHNFLGGKQNPGHVEHTCPYCSFVGKGGSMYRWHFNNCKENR